MKKLLFFLLVVTLASSCNKMSNPTTTIHEMTIPGFYVHLTWVNGWLVVHEGSQPYLNRLWRFRPDGSELEQLSLPDTYEGCRRTGFEAPTRLPDGRLGYMRRCDTDQLWVSLLYMMAYDMDTGAVEQLTGALPTDGTPTGDWSWNSSMTRGITSDGRGAGLAEQLFWFTSEGWEYIDLGFPQAHGVSWSPDGRQIAFEAAPEQGLSGVRGWDAVYNLYLMDPESMDFQLLVKGYRYPRGTSWSADSKWLAFTGDFSRLTIGKEGLWVVNIDTAERHLLAEGSFSQPVFSPDGQQIAALQFPEDPLTDLKALGYTSVVIIDLSDMLSETSE